MTRREKSLAAGLTVLTATMSCARLGTSFSPSPDSLAGGRVPLVRLEAQRDSVLEIIHQRYHELYRRRVEDPTELLGTFMQLIEDAGLTDRTARQLSTARNKQGDRFLRFRLSGNGSTAECLSLMNRFYALPYMLRFDSINLSPASTSSEDDRVVFDAEVHAPELPMLPDFTPRTQPKDLLRARHELSELTSLAKWNPFGLKLSVPFTPDPGDKEDEKSKKGSDADSDRVSPLPNPYVLTMTMSYGRKEAMVRNDATGDSRYVCIGSALDGGTLVDIRPDGVVCRLTSKDDVSQFFFYPIGEPLSRRRLMPESWRDT